MASQEGKLEVVKYLVEERKAEVDKARIDGWTSLLKAQEKGQKETIEYVKGKGSKD